MRKVILYIATSIDGYLADEKGGVDWLATGSTPNDVTDPTYDQLMQEIDTVIMGRTTYDQVMNDLSPGHYPYEEKVSYVLTSRPGDGNEAVQFVDGSVNALIDKLQSEQGGAIWVVGGSHVIAPLIEHNRIDDYRLATIPVLLGKGIPLFSPQQLPLSFTLKETYQVNQISYRHYTKE